VNAFFPHGVERYLVGGVLIGLGVALLFVTTGRQGGMSTFFSSAWSYFSESPFFQQPALRGTRNWRAAYALGTVLGGAALVAAGLPAHGTELQFWRLVAGGLLAGFGARLGGGCTSGHGICGIASLSPGSLVIVVTFLTTAIATANVVALAGVRP
jgi:uncharacterized protein